ncbi:RagB/SusD family nutrient uptake outer membrane protein [Carboxylicivirga sp. M1479]|uniref:RagB/SusD family nutrient uptake outer membrane protein n=1 Tax=Carboxylicivirga sp. M1479 TaxID=2594476 RepID=UPI0011774EB2|nr:RagB/SusD family nutrient uptake outer membrane protein [Carboxylicivirga sp. M1479]TRX66563.1 RagB/SusD family nutrient uptake outer membrane protein [Carboxylicivirga sp. M1479]
MKNIKLSIYTLLLIFAFGACSDSVLDKTPIGKFNSADYLTTEAEAEAAIIGVYDYLQIGYNNYGDWSSIFFIKLLSGDDVNTGGGSSADQPKLQQLNDFSYEYDNPAIKDVWHSYYKIVNASNAILNTVSPDLENAEQIMAEAKFFRAFAYFELVTMWGDVPFYLENTTEISVNNPRADKATIYTQIHKDLTEAIAVLPVKKDLEEGLKFRVSKGAAQALKGKVFLYQEDYAAAHPLLQDVIDDASYSLTEDYSTIWMRGERAGSESIFEVLYSSQNAHDWGGPWDGTAESNFVVQLMGPRGDDSFNNMDAIGYVNGWGFNVPTSKFGALLNAEAGAERAATSVISEADFEAAGGEVNNPGGNNNWDAYEGYIRLKYSTLPSETSDGGVKEVNWNTPFKLIRLSDVMLMAAEAYNRDGMDAHAVPLIRDVRERAGFTDHTAWETLVGNDLFNIIKKERSLELAFEGHRFWDLVRWGDAGAELASRGFKTGKNELFPIPQEEIDLNGGISTEDQNPGYN